VRAAATDAVCALRARLADAAAAVAQADELLDAQRRFAESESAVLARLAAFDLTAADGAEGSVADESGIEALEMLAARRSEAVVALTAMLTGVRRDAQAVRTAGAAVRETTEILAVGAAAQRAATSEAADTLRRVSEASARQAEHVQEIEGVIAAAAAGVEQVYALRRVVDDMRETSLATARIVRMIAEVAKQSRLLSLNAAIEAARAGDAGNAFAVVAEEMRRLAERSADAAQQTALLVDKAVRAAADGSAVDVDGLARSVESIATVMTNVVRATSEDRAHLEQIAGVMEYLAELMPRTADQATAAAEAGAELVARTQALWASQARIVLPEARAPDAGGAGEPAGFVVPAAAVGAATPISATDWFATGEEGLRGTTGSAGLTLRFLGDTPGSVADDAAPVPEASSAPGGLTLPSPDNGDAVPPATSDDDPAPLTLNWLDS
jgi:methyl-accepting chemotaxis protein